MNMLFKATKIKILEIAIDILFNRLRLNFINYSRDVILPKDVVVGMKISEIICTSPMMEGAVFRNCKILEVNDHTDNYGEKSKSIMFEFEEIGNSPYEISSDEDRIDTIYVNERSDGFILVK